jgi:predicted ester cyclase
MQVETKVSPENVVRNLREALAAFNDHHDLDAYLAIMDPNFVLHDPLFPEPIKGRETCRKLDEELIKAFPDLEYKILNVAASSDLVAAEVLLSGTFKGPMKLPQGTITPTGHYGEITCAVFYQLNSKGLLTEARWYYDVAALRQRLGMKA